MTEADRIALLVFLLLVSVGGLWLFATRLFKKSRKQMVIDRLIQVAQVEEDETEVRTLTDLARLQREARRRRIRASLGRVGTYMARMEALSGRTGLYAVIVAVPAFFVFMLLVNWLLLPFPWWMETSLAIFMPAAVAYLIHQMLVERFRNAFLAQMPDILDTITRASQAGVPVTLAIRNIGDMYNWPAGPEFRRIGQSLQVGNDMAVVLDEAELRIRLPDFSFLCVCLMLQRETGGSLSSALSNLAGVIRERRDLRLKARALTSEARIMSKVIAAIPLLMLGMMWFLNPDYIMVLFDTPTGNTILLVASVMLLIGLLLVNRMAKLNV